jgi:hypothetical protein
MPTCISGRMSAPMELTPWIFEYAQPISDLLPEGQTR